MTAQADAEPTPPRRRGGRVVRIVGSVLLALAILTVVALWLDRRYVDARVRDQRAKTVAKGPRLAVVRVETTAADRVITLPAEVRAFDQTTLYARVPGYVREVRVERGDKVKKGDVVAIIDSPETEQAVLAAQSALDNSQRTSDRVGALVRPGVVSQQDLDNATNATKNARANLETMLAARGYTQVRAPFDGIIAARYADPGALLQAATPLVDVAGPDRVRIFVYLGQDAAPFVRTGDTVNVWQDELPGRRIPATVTRTTSALDPRTRTMLCEIDLDNRRWGILPGSYMHAELHLLVPPSPVVPDDAIIVRDGKLSVAVVDGDQAHLVAVELGTNDGKTTRVLRGLRGGETIGVNVPLEVVEGTTVQPSPR